MKNIIPIIASIILLMSGVSSTTAQSPHLINYQAVARNTTSGQELAHQPIFVSIKILASNPNGDLVYQENHNGIETNYLGLFNLFIGGGEPVSGSFADIQWGGTEYWLAVAIDAGQGLQSMGSMQFVAVPYALHAETVSQIDDADADPTNELVHDIGFNSETNVFSLTQQGGTLTQDLSGLLEGVDTDATNELVQAIEFDSETSVFSLIQENGTLTQNLSALIDDADSDPTNELVYDIDFNSETKIFSLIQQGGTLTQDLSGLLEGVDTDPTNELVQYIKFDPQTSIFSLIQEGGTLTLDLSPLIDDADSDPLNEAITNIQLIGTNLVVNEVEDWSVNLSQLVDDADSDPTNELVQNIKFDPETSIFSLIQEGGTLTEDLSALIDDADSDPTNELVHSINFNAQTSIFSLVQEGGSLEQDLSPLINDADADPTNELINSLTLVNDTILKIQEGPTGELSLNLAPLKRDENWTKSDNASVSNIGTSVGIGTSTPRSTLQVDGSIGYKVTLLENSSGPLSYNVTDTDHVIVCKVEPPATSIISIEMPAASSCPGRSITIRRTGSTPLFASVVITFGSDKIEFEDGIYSMSDFQRETVTFISLGSNGWTKL